MINVSDIIRALGMKQRSDELRALDALGPAERAQLGRALAALPLGARVDVSQLAAHARVSRVEPQEPETPDLKGAFRYWVTIAEIDELERARRLLQAGASVEATYAEVALGRVLTHHETQEDVRGHEFGESDEEPHEEPDETPPDPPPAPAKPPTTPGDGQG